MKHFTRRKLATTLEREQMSSEASVLAAQMMHHLVGCPYCAGDPAPIDLADDLTAIGCQKCGSIGPVSKDESPAVRLKEAAEAWNRRDLTDKRVLAAKAGADPCNGLTVVALESTGKDLLRNIFGRVDAYVLILFDSATNHVSLTKYRLDETEAEKLLLGTADGIRAGQDRKNQVAPGGIVLPPGVRL